MASEGKSTVSKKTKPASKGEEEQIVAGFNELRQQQRAVASKINELQMEQKEHDLVIDTLKEVDGDRKCFRLVGGVLVERTVKEVLPALIHNHEQMTKLIESLMKQLETKGKDLNEYREKHNIKIKGETPGGDAPSQEAPSSGKTSSQGVLVAKELS